MEKLELEHIVGYLPYELKYKDKHEGFNEIRTLCINTIGWFLYEGKPILRPLSDLTKEIEINSEKFIPIYKLFEIEYEGTEHVKSIRDMYYKINYTFTCSSHYATAMETSINTKYISKNNHWKIEKLFEWHFDLHSLIEKNLAIDINTLK